MRTERFTTRATEAIAAAQQMAEGYDPQYGARPLRRAIQRLVENPLAKRILGGDFPAGSTGRVDSRDGTLSFEKMTAGASAEPVV
jgi:ATP-dependent Clp protease ATP-binding subunit ClpA